MGDPPAKGDVPVRGDAPVDRASRPTLAVGMVVGVVAVSTSPILVRVAELPALALAFWRCLAGAVVLAPFALRGRRRGQGNPKGVPRRIGNLERLERGDVVRLVAAGVFLAVHFALWNASLALTTVAASTTLVSCAPLFVGLGARFFGEAPSRRAWLGIVLATAGAVLIGLGDAAGWPDPPAGQQASPSDPPTPRGPSPAGSAALLGDALAFAGAGAVAAYLLLGRALRQRLPVTTYAASVYGVAAAVLLPACLLTGAGLGGYPAGSWLALAAIVAGPQLLGHTVFNGLLGTVGASVVAVVLLVEPIGATALAWLAFEELPGSSFWLGAPLVLAGVWLATTGSRRM